MSKYWISVRAIQGDQFSDEIDLGATRYLKIPDNEVPTPKHQIPRQQWLSEVVGSFPAVKNILFPKVDKVPTGDILFFVHGYNNTVDDVDQRHQLIQQGLTKNEFNCMVISFDWPSSSSPLAYLLDRDHAKNTAIRLVNAGILLFVKAQKLVCDIKVHVLGHSTGAYAIREALDHADDGQVTGTDWTVGQLVLIAGDVSSKSFSASDPETESTYRHCNRLTNYFNGYDEVLQVSNVKRIGFSPRVGRVGLPSDAPEKAVDVNCSKHFETAYGSSGLVKSHSWYFEDDEFHKDLAITLRGKIDRNYIPTRDTGEGRVQILK
jgi:esterase/lipase superfamily enzyme